MLSEDLALFSLWRHERDVFLKRFAAFSKRGFFRAKELLVSVLGGCGAVVSVAVPHLLVEALGSSVQIIVFVGFEPMLGLEVNR